MSGGSSRHATRTTTWPAQRRSSPSATGSSGCVAPSRRGARLCRLARTSTVSTRRGRSCTPRRPTDWRESARRSSTSRTPPSSSSTSTMSREFVWALASGKHVRVRSCRLVSFEHRHLVAMTYEVTMLDHAAPVAISSQVANRQDTRPVDEIPEHRPSDPRLAKVLPERVLNTQVTEQADGRILLGYRTTNSKMTLAVGVDHVIDAACPYQVEGSVEQDSGEILITADASPGVPIRITKFATYQGSRSIPAPELVDRRRRTLDRALRVGFDILVRQQRQQLELFWDRADVRVESRADQVRRQQAIRWNLFQVAQASWRAENAGISAKGLTGHAYDGHYFWDTEIYVLPFLSNTQPRIAANLLRHRHSMLDRARERATVMSQKGALFPWRTLTGQE